MSSYSNCPQSYIGLKCHLRQLRFAPNVLVYMHKINVVLIFIHLLPLCVSAAIIISAEDFKYHIYEESFTPSTAGSDYTAVTETLPFGSGMMTQCITVPTIDNNIDEVTECFSVNLFGTQTGLTLNPATTTVCITDNDGTFSSQTGTPIMNVI